MKRIFIIIVLTLTTYAASFAQGKFSANFTNTSNLLTFKLKPDANISTGFSTIEFFVRYPDPSPAFTYGRVTVNTVAFPGMLGDGNIGGGTPGSGAWEIERDNPAYALPGFHVDHFIYTAPAIITSTAPYTGGTEYDVFSVRLLGTPPATVDLQFVSDDQESTYYLAITDQLGADLRPAAIANYFYPAFATTPGPNGASIYYLELVDVPLPVKFLNFTATKNNNAAILNWAVENENANTASYEIERSLSGVEFSTVATLPALNNGRTSNTYSFTQDNLTGVRSSGVIYFRIKQIDRDGKFVYTEIRSVRLDSKGLVVGVYPNPIKNIANVSFDLPESSDVIIRVTDAAGKQMSVSQVQGFKGANINKLDMSRFATGSYTLSVKAGTETKTMTIVKAEQ